MGHYAGASVVLSAHFAVLLLCVYVNKPSVSKPPWELPKTAPQPLPPFAHYTQSVGRMFSLALAGLLFLLFAGCITLLFGLGARITWSAAGIVAFGMVLTLIAGAFNRLYYHLAMVGVYMLLMVPLSLLPGNLSLQLAVVALLVAFTPGLYTLLDYWRKEGALRYRFVSVPWWMVALGVAVFFDQIGSALTDVGMYRWAQESRILGDTLHPLVPASNASVFQAMCFASQRFSLEPLTALAALMVVQAMVVWSYRLRSRVLRVYPLVGWAAGAAAGVWYSIIAARPVAGSAFVAAGVGAGALVGAWQSGHGRILLRFKPRYRESA